VVPTGPTSVTVVAPGGGTSANACVYAELGRLPEFKLDIAGHSRAPYDRYPPSWPQGAAGPNLETFAKELLDQGKVERSDLLVVGSRGGQVVLPYVWRSLGDRAPPAVVLNGGCAMQLPTAVQWPKAAITFILIGGQDNFRGNMSLEEYVADAKSRVPKSNGTTAILFVNEMVHMPQANLLSAVLRPMLKTLLTWQKTGPSQAPQAELQAVLAALTQMRCWNGRLMYTQAPGAWQDIPFSPSGPAPTKRQQLAAFGGA